MAVHPGFLMPAASITCPGLKIWETRSENSKFLCRNRSSVPRKSKRVTREQTELCLRNQTIALEGLIKTQELRVFR